MESLWNKLSENQTPSSFPSSAALLTIFLESMEPSFDNLGDVFEGDRKKLIHSVGNVAKAKFISSPDSPYTGIFKGSSQVLVRLSTAKDFDTSKTKPQGAYGNFVPGMAIKFLRDGIHSTNILAMKSVMGQNSWNFFYHDFTNDFDLPSDADMSLQLLSRKFMSVTSYIGSLGLKELSERDELGQEIWPIKYPYKLVFRPNPEVRNLFSDDFKEHYQEQLRRIKPGTVLYEVYAVEQPWCGDEKLFFRHNYVHEDIKDYKIWGEYKDQFGWLGIYEGKQPQRKKCPFSSLMGLFE